MKLAILLIATLVQANIKFYFDDDIENKCDCNRKHTTDDCLKCPPQYIADPFRKTCIASVNYFGEALGWGDHCIMRSG